MSHKNAYDLLGVSKDASKIEIKRAYYRKIKQYTNEKYPKEFELYRKAYERLMGNEGILIDEDDLKKHKYDKMYQSAKEYLTVGDYESAYKITLQLIKLFPEREYYRLLLAQCYYRLQRYREAENILIALIEKNPSNRSYYIHLAELYVHLNEYTNVWQTFAAARKLLPLELDDLRVVLERYFIGYQLDNTNEYHGALIDLEQFVHREDRLLVLQMIMKRIGNISIKHPGLPALIVFIDRVNNQEDPYINRWLTGYAHLLTGNSNIQSIRRGQKKGVEKIEWADLSKKRHSIAKKDETKKIHEQLSFWLVLIALVVGLMIIYSIR